MENTTYKEDLEIDKHNLDIDWENQSMLFMKWAERHAQAMLDRDKAKEQLDICYAETDAEIRSDPDGYGLIYDKKPTETAIKSAITTDETYKATNEKFINSVKDVNILLAAKTAMEHKKKALEMLTHLYIAGYFSEPDISKDVNSKMDKKITSRKLKTKREERKGK